MDEYRDIGHTHQTTNTNKRLAFGEEIYVLSNF